MITTKEADEIYEEIMAAYGSDSGWLFGIDRKHKQSIIAIIQYTVNRTKAEAASDGL